MSPPLLGIGEEGGQSNVTLLASSNSLENVQQGMELKERNYMGLTDGSRETLLVSNVIDESKKTLNLKATELRLGLPGSQSPQRDSELSLASSSQLDEKPLFPLHPSTDEQFPSSQKQVVSGNKRGFCDVIDVFSDGKYLSNSEVNPMLSPRPSNVGLRPGSRLENLGTQLHKIKEVANQKKAPERPCTTNEAGQNHNASANNSGAPAAKAQVVGWPPIRQSRKNSLATTSKNGNEVDAKSGSDLFVKVSMDGAPYLRKIDLSTYRAYQELSSGLEKMFNCIIIGQYGSNGTGVGELPRDSKLKDLLSGTENVLTYEDKDGDWMLVGDVPWEMFVDTCKRLRIMKRSDAIGLAPRAGEKSVIKN